MSFPCFYLFALLAQVQHSTFGFVAVAICNFLGCVVSDRFSNADGSAGSGLFLSSIRFFCILAFCSSRAICYSNFFPA
jgi:hypothetical protein